MFAENLSVFTRDFGQLCTANGRTFTGILDAPDDTLNMGGVNVLSTMYVLQTPAADVLAAGIVSGTDITVSGVPFVVRDVLSLEDGAFNQLTLSK